MSFPVQWLKIPYYNMLNLTSHVWLWAKPISTLPCMDIGDPRDTLLIRHFTGLGIYFSRFLRDKSYRLFGNNESELWPADIGQKKGVNEEGDTFQCMIYETRSHSSYTLICRPHQQELCSDKILCKEQNKSQVFYNK